MKRLLLLRHSSQLRHIGEAEVVESLSADDQRLERRHLEIDMTPFADAIEQGDWAGQDQSLRESAARVKQLANELDDAELHYFGLAEIPHIIALGAHVGDERFVAFHDYDRDAGKWRWPSELPTLEITSVGDHELTAPVRARGPAVIRVAISAAISDVDVREVVGDATLADVTITHKLINSSAITRVRSAADVDLIRREFRRVFALLRNTRPNVDMIHLFVAGPPSVCFAVGQELTLRNCPPVQLYRFRKSSDRASYQVALSLRATGEARVLVPLTAEEIKIASWIRTEIWPLALTDVKTYVANKKGDGAQNGSWYRGLRPQEIADAEPFPSLPPLALVVPDGAQVDPEPFSGEYGFDKTHLTWRLGDRLLLGFYRAVDEDQQRLRQLIRLFLFHEYLHLYHSITKHTAEEVGKFSNCLEYLDYTADAYAILHQLDLSRYSDGSLLGAEAARKFLARQVEMAIKGFWAFDIETETEWQVRRIRRYLNWYWRLVQLQRSNDLKSVAKIFRRQPHLEIGGLYQLVRGRRLMADLDRRDASTHLELGIVLENEKFLRITDSPNINLLALLDAFKHGEHESIKQFFEAVYDTAEPVGGVQPAGDSQ